MRKRQIQAIYEMLIKTRPMRHFKEFGAIWALIGVLFLVAIIGCWDITHTFSHILIILAAVLFTAFPMNGVYGLMGTTGSIRLFFVNFIIISFIFAGIYQFGIFRYAGISYDVNQPHIDFSIYEDANNKKPQIVLKENQDTIVSLQLSNNVVTSRDTVIHVSQLHYQPIEFWFTFRNTILTSLMQEPTDFFSIVSTYNTGMEEAATGNKSLLNLQKSELFHWILIFQILISWIFFGVFISLLYSKFRYES